jgi:hypothetical protein
MVRFLIVLSLVVLFNISVNFVIFGKRFAGKTFEKTPPTRKPGVSLS